MYSVGSKALGIPAAIVVGGEDDFLFAVVVMFVCVVFYVMICG